MKSHSLFHRFFIIVCIFTLSVCAMPTDTLAITANFEDVSLPPIGYYNGSDYAGGFTSQGVFFPNSYFDFGGGFTSWENWACSNKTDTTTPGYGNQYSAIAGSGHNSAQYAVSYPSLATGVSTFSLPYAASVNNAYFTNTTYAYLSMLNGDGFAKKFGGKNGTDPDWFLLTISGKNASGDILGSVDFYLADYRFGNSLDDYIINNWTSVALGSLGNNVKTLEFEMSSSDVGSFGINTPTYFAMDDLSTSVENTWTGSHNSTWDNAANWSFGSMPGTGQNAIFNNIANTTINLNGNRRIQNMAFDTAAVGSYTFNNNTLTLDADGSITVTGQVTTSQTFNCVLALSGNGFLVNDSIASGQLLNITGDIRSSASSGIQNLTLAGSGNGTISGKVRDGSTGGALALIKQGTGIWTLTTDTDYSGETTIQEGLLQFNGVQSNLGDISGDGNLGVGDGVNSSTLTASLISVNSLTVANGSVVVLGAATGGQSSAHHSLTTVPEPGVFVLFIMAAGGLLIKRQYRDQ